MGYCTRTQLSRNDKRESPWLKACSLTIIPLYRLEAWTSFSLEQHKPTMSLIILPPSDTNWAFSLCDLHSQNNVRP